MTASQTQGRSRGGNQTLLPYANDEGTHKPMPHSPKKKIILNLNLLSFPPDQCAPEDRFYCDMAYKKVSWLTYW